MARDRTERNLAAIGALVVYAKTGELNAPKAVLGGPLIDRERRSKVGRSAIVIWHEKFGDRIDALSAAVSSAGEEALPSLHKESRTLLAIATVSILKCHQLEDQRVPR